VKREKTERGGARGGGTPSVDADTVTARTTDFFHTQSDQTKIEREVA